MIRDFVNFIFPPHCFVCGKPTSGTHLCDDCKSKIEFLEYPLIYHKDKVYFYAITRYRGVSENVVKLLRFRGKKRIAEDIGMIFYHFLSQNDISPDFIGFVPMSRKEERERSFNQSYLIAKAISINAHIPLYFGIKKLRDTAKQVGLTRAGRIKNVKGAFAFTEPVQGSLLVVDDVYTTGSTLKEIARVSKKFVSGNLYLIAFSQKLG